MSEVNPAPETEETPATPVFLDDEETVELIREGVKHLREINANIQTLLEAIAGLAETK